MKNKKTVVGKSFDQLGLGVSSLCLIHCLLLPVLLLLFPASKVWLGDYHGHVHYFLYLVILPVSLLAFLPRAIKDKQWEFLWGPCCGVILLGLTLYLHEHALLPYDSITEPFLTSVGSLCLIYFHWRNFKLRSHKCPTGEHHHRH